MTMVLVAGLLAACIVVFVPLAMAGWHLTRNKILFSSAMLFIVLAVAVHILPYAPSFPSIFSNVHSTVSSILQPRRLRPSSCLSHLYHVNWHRNASVNSSYNSATWSWTEPALDSCSLNRFSRASALEFLSGAWIRVAGDSEARYFLVSLLRLLLDNVEPVQEKLLRYHSNYEHSIEEQQIKLDFVWAPYTDNLTELVRQMQGNRSFPDVLVMDAGLWHMLHVNNASDYGQSLVRLRSSIADYAAPGSRVPYMFWLNLPTLVHSLLNTEAKKDRLNSQVLRDYEQQLCRKMDSIHRLSFLDLKEVSRSCGAECTLDGMHFADEVYGLLVHAMLHTLKAA